MNSNFYSYRKGEQKENKGNSNLLSDNKENIKPKGISLKQPTRTPLRDITNIYEFDNYSPGLKEKEKEFTTPESSQIKKQENSYLYTTAQKSSVRSQLKFIR